MGQFLGSLNLNSRKTKKTEGKVNTDEMTRGGIKRDQISLKYRVIFDALNKKNANGQIDEILDEKEIEDFWTKLTECAHDDTLGGREAGKFLKGLNLKDLKKEDLYAFINEISNLSAGIDSTETVEDEEGNKTITINYHSKEGQPTRQEKVFHNGTSQLATTDTDGTVTTEYINAQKIKEKETVEKNDYLEETTYVTHGAVLDENGEVKLDENGDFVLEEQGSIALDSKGNPIPVTTTVTTNNGTRKAVINYDGAGDKTTETITDSGDNSEERYIYDTDSHGEEIRLLQTRIENKGEDNQTVTGFEYDEDGNKTSSTTTYKGSDKEVVKRYADDGESVIEENISENNGRNRTQIRYGSNGNTYTTTWTNVVGETVGDDGSVTYQVTKDCRKEQTSRNADGLATGQTVTKNGKEYRIDYDGEGNTVGIVVQFGETPEKIAKKFGCEDKIDELVALNGGRQAFSTGAKIKVPGEVQADAKVLQGRGTSAQEIRKQQIHDARVARERAMKQDENSRVLIENYEIRDVGDDKLWACQSARDIALVLFEKEGRTSVTQTELNRRIAQIKADNPGKFGDRTPEGVKTFRGKIGERGIAGHKLNLRVAPSVAEQYGAQTTRVNDVEIPYEEERNNRKGNDLVGMLFKSQRKPGQYDYGKVKLQDVYNGINKKTVQGFVSGYEARSKGGKNIFEFMHEKGGNIEKSFNQKIKNSLVARAKELGLPQSEIDKLNIIGSGKDPKTVGRQVNEVIGLMKTLQSAKPSQRKEELQALLKTDGPADVDVVGEISKKNASDASAIVSGQLKNEGWAEWLFDRTMNWSDSSSSATKARIEAFKGKFNSVRQASMKNGKIDDAAFRANFQKEFGVPYNQRLMNQFKSTQKKLGYGLAYDDYFKNFVSNDATQMDANALKAKMLSYPAFKDKTKQAQISKLSSKEDLCAYLDSYSMELQKHCGTKDVDTLGRELSDLSRKVFGPKNDVIGDAKHFVDVQRKGGGYVELGATIAVTMATGGLGGGAAAVTLTAGAMPLLSETGDGLMKAYAQQGDAIYETDAKGNVVVDEATGKPKVIGHKTFGQAFNENTDYTSAVGESLLNMAMVKGGGKFVTSFREAALSGTATKSQTLVCDLISSEVLSVGTEALMSGDISWEGVAMGAMPLLGARSGKGKKGAPASESTAAEKPMSDALHTAGKGSPYSSSVRVGETKAKTIKNQIETRVQEGNYSTKELLEARRDAHIIENRDLQHTVNERLDAIAKEKLSPSEFADYQAGRKAQIMEWSENALSGKGVLPPSEAKNIRASLDYMTPEQLKAAKTQLEARKGRYVQGKDHAAQLITEIEARLVPANAQGATMQTVTDALANRAAQRKGLSVQERADLEVVIGRTNDANALNSLKQQWQKARKFAGTSDKKKIDKLFTDRAAYLESQPKAPTFTPVVESGSAVRSTSFIDQQFTNQLQQSKMYQNTKGQSSVRRLGGQKAVEYYQEVADLCNKAMTTEQLNQIKTMVDKFRGNTAPNQYSGTSDIGRMYELIEARRAQLSGGRSYELYQDPHSILIDPLESSVLSTGNSIWGSAPKATSSRPSGGEPFNKGKGVVDIKKKQEMN